MNFGDKIALIVGGTGALGRAVSRAFLEQGAAVIVTYRNELEWRALKDVAGTNTSRLAGHQVDVTDDRAMERLVRTVTGENGHLDIVVNTVGGYAGGTNLWQLAPDVFDRMVALNLRSAYLLWRVVLPGMLARGQGSIVQIAAKAAFDHAPGAAAYVASKAAVVAMMDSLAAEVKGSGVRVNSVLPSIIDTEANRQAMPNADFSKWPKPNDIARVILFLCSEDAKLIHGAAVPVYG